MIMNIHMYYILKKKSKKEILMKLNQVMMNIITVVYVEIFGQILPNHFYVKKCKKCKKM